jgi:Ca-activated chloride channel family protein
LKIFTIGIGTAAGDLIRVTDANGNSDYVRDEQGNVVKSHLNEPLLQQIASVTGGFYLPLRGANTIDTLYERGLEPLPKSEGREKLVKRYHEQFQWPLAAAILLLLAEMFLPERRRARKVSRNDLPHPGPLPSVSAALRRDSSQTAPKRSEGGKEGEKRSPLSGMGGAMVLFVLLGFAGNTLASPASALHDYKSGNYTNALAEYERLAETSTNDLRLVFNAGVAAYRATNFDEATKLFQAVTAAPDLKLQQQAYYNLGNVQYRAAAAAKELDGLQEAWESAIKTYERAVALNTNDVDAVFNLAFVRNGVEQIKQFREAMRRAKSDADAAVRQRNYHRALEIMEQLTQNKIAAKQFEEFTKKLKDIDAIATPHQP